jgi:hypothetical protein
MERTRVFLAAVAMTTRCGGEATRGEEGGR